MTPRQEVKIAVLRKEMMETFFLPRLLRLLRALMFMFSTGALKGEENSASVFGSTIV